MKKKRNRAIRLTLITFITLIVLSTGCSVDGDTPADTDASQTSNVENSETNGTGTDESDVAAANKEDFHAELSILAWGDAFRDKFEALIADFNKEYPNITIHYLEQSIAELPALIAAGQTPDIVSSGDTMPDWRANDLIEDLAPWIESDPAVSKEMWYDLATERSNIDGQQWAIPWELDVLFGIIYNKTIFDQYGITQFPELNTLQELDEFNKSFWVMNAGEQEMTGFHLENVAGSGANLTLMTLAYLNGADETTFFNPETETVGFNDPKIVEAAEYMVNFRREVIDDELLGQLQASLPEGMSRFLGGKQALEVTHSPTSIDFIYREDPDQFGVAMLPRDALWFGGWDWAMTSGGENKEAAWELLKWMTATTEGAQSQYDHFKKHSPLIDNPILEELRQNDPVIQSYYEGLQVTEKIPYRSVFPVNIEPEFNEQFQDVLNGNIEPKAFLDHMTEYAQTLYDEQYK